MVFIYPRISLKLALSPWDFRILFSYIIDSLCDLHINIWGCELDVSRLIGGQAG